MMCWKDMRLCECERGCLRMCIANLSELVISDYVYTIRYHCLRYFYCIMFSKLIILLLIIIFIVSPIVPLDIEGFLNKACKSITCFLCTRLTCYQ